MSKILHFPRKICPAVIKVSSYLSKGLLVKNVRANDRTPHIIQQDISVHKEYLYSEPQPQTMKPPVSRCGLVCTHPMRRVAPVHLRKAETRCRGLFERLWREQLYLRIETAEQSRVRGGWGSSPSLPTVLSPLSQQIFRRVCVRQNAQGEGQCRGSIFAQDKGRGSQAAPAQITTPRNAGRFKGFDVSGSGDQRWSVDLTSDLTGGHTLPQTSTAQRICGCTCGVHLGGQGQELTGGGFLRPAIGHLKKRGTVNKNRVLATILSGNELHHCLQKKSRQRRRKKICLN